MRTFRWMVSRTESSSLENEEIELAALYQTRISRRSSFISLGSFRRSELISRKINRKFLQIVYYKH
uniref:Uncharacterized protein n=1 Tax=Glossina palpalis gambiensis TaxID=67801 RepID=A0A1B0AT67_9MUSC